MLGKIARRVREPSIIAVDVRKLFNKIRRPDVIKIQGVKVPLGPHISPDIRNYMYAGIYERDEAEILQKKLRPDDVVVELGGGIGFISALCSKVVPPSDIHVYEANKKLESSIRKLYELNSISPDLRMYALGPREDQMRLTVSDHFWESSAFTDNMAAPRETVTVPVREFVAETSTFPRPPTFLIIDIEGGEFDFFRDAKIPTIRKILCEVHEAVLGKQKIDELRTMLTTQGFVFDDKVSKERVWYLEKR